MINLVVLFQDWLPKYWTYLITDEIGKEGLITEEKTTPKEVK